MCTAGMLCSERLWVEGWEEKAWKVIARRLNVRKAISTYLKPIPHIHKNSRLLCEYPTQNGSTQDESTNDSTQGDDTQDDSIDFCANGMVQVDFCTC